MPSEEIIQPLGLITQPSQAGVMPAGALAKALGVYMRDPGVLTTQQALDSLSFFVVPTSSLAPVFTMHPDLSTNLGVSWFQDPNNSNRWSYAWFDTTGSPTISTAFVNWTTITRQTVPSNEVLTTQARFSYAATFNQTVIPFRDSNVMFTLDPSLSAPTAEYAGIGSPAIYYGGVDTSGGWFANGKHTQYTAVVRRVLFDGTEVVSAPGTCVHAFGSSPVSGTAPGITPIINVTHYLGMKTNDFIDFYRTKQQAIGTNLGSDYYKCGTVTFDTTSLAQFKDTTAEESLGEALYTNSGVRGAASGNLVPPKCKAVANFKGYTFYIGVTEPPAARLGLGTGAGYLGISTDVPINFRRDALGSRQVTGNVTSGSPTITSISTDNMIGIQVGQTLVQMVTGGLIGSFGIGTLIISKTATSITINQNFTGTATGAGLIFGDVLQIDGITVPINAGSAGPADGLDLLFYYLYGQNDYGTRLYAQMLDRVYPPAAMTPAGSSSVPVPSDGLVFTRPGQMNSSGLNTISVRATNGQNYVPALPRVELSEAARVYTELPKKNVTRWSEQNQIASCPSANRASIGNGELYMGSPTRDALWMWSSDGLWRLSGSGGAAGSPGYDWRVDPVDSTISLAGPCAWCVYRDQVYAYTNRGLVVIDSSGNITSLTQGRLGDVLPGYSWDPTRLDVMIADEVNNEILLKVPASNSIYVYNVLTDKFTQMLSTVFGTPATTMSYARSNATAYFSGPSIGNLYFVNTALAPVPLWSFSYHPFFGSDPWQKKRWQRVHFAFASVNNDSVFVRINGVNSPNANLTTASASPQSNFTRLSVSVPRHSAVSNNIAVELNGSASPGSAVLRYFGVSVDFVPMTQQRLNRAANR